MEELKKRILSGQIKMYFVKENRLAIYGKTYEVRNELKEFGAEWNHQRKRLEMDEEEFKKLDTEIIDKVFEEREKQREANIENISQLLLSGELKAFLNKSDNYIIYGKVKTITKDLANVGFNFSNNNYAIKREDFERLFSNEVKEFVNEYNKNNQSENTEKIIYEEELQEEEEVEC